MPTHTHPLSFPPPQLANQNEYLHLQQHASPVNSQVAIKGEWVGSRAPGTPAGQGCAQAALALLDGPMHCLLQPCGCSIGPFSLPSESRRRLCLPAFTGEARACQN